MHWFRYASAQIGLTEISASIPAGMIADATIIAAPSSTKNAAAAREPEMQQTKKGQQWGP
jgi:IS5 family transposase